MFAFKTLCYCCYWSFIKNLFLLIFCKNQKSSLQCWCNINLEVICQKYPDIGFCPHCPALLQSTESHLPSHQKVGQWCLDKNNDLNIPSPSCVKSQVTKTFLGQCFFSFHCCLKSLLLPQSAAFYLLEPSSIFVFFAAAVKWSKDWSLCIPHIANNNLRNQKNKTAVRVVFHLIKDARRQ